MLAAVRCSEMGTETIVTDKHLFACQVTGLLTSVLWTTWRQFRGPGVGGTSIAVLLVSCLRLGTGRGAGLPDRCRNEHSLIQQGTMSHNLVFRLFCVVATEPPVSFETSFSVRVVPDQVLAANPLFANVEDLVTTSRPAPHSVRLSLPPSPQGTKDGGHSHR